MPSLIRPSKSQRLPPRRRIRIEHRLLRQTRHTSPMSRLQTAIIIRSIMHRNPTNQSQLSTHNHPIIITAAEKNSPIIPQRTRPRSPPKPDLNIHIPLIHFKQILQNRIALPIIQADNPLRHRAVDEQALPAGDRVHAHKRVAALDVLGPGVRIVAVEVGVRGAEDGVFAVDDFAEIGRQFLVG
jgi:hypothetical protein